MAQEIKVTFVDGAVYDGFASTYTSPNGEVTWYFDADLDYRLQVDELGGTPSFQQYKTRSGGWVDISIIQNVEFKNISGTVSQLEPLTIYPSEGEPIVYDGSEAVSVSLASGGSGISEERARELFVLKAGDTMTGSLIVGDENGRHVRVNTNGRLQCYNDSNVISCSLGASNTNTGYVETFDPEGNINIRLSNVSSHTSNGFINVYNSDNMSVVRMYATSASNSGRIDMYNAGDNTFFTSLTHSGVYGNRNGNATFALSTSVDTVQSGTLFLYNNVGNAVHRMGVIAGTSYPAYSMCNSAGRQRLVIDSVHTYYADDNGVLRLTIGREDGDLKYGYVNIYGSNVSDYTKIKGNETKSNDYYLVSNGDIDMTAYGHIDCYANGGYAILRSSTSAVIEGYNGVVLSNTRSSSASDIFKFIEFTYDWYNHGSAYSKTLDEIYQVLYQRLSTVNVTNITNHIVNKTADLPTIDTFLLSWASYIVGEVITTNLGIASSVFTQTLLRAIEAVNNNPLAINKYVNSNMVVPMYNTLNQ